MSGLIKFTDQAGNEINELPASYEDTRNFSIVILGSGTQAILGDILLNTMKVGEVSWRPSEGSRQKWYSGGSRFIPVKAGDVFHVNITSPTVSSRSLPVNRYQPTFQETEKQRLSRLIAVMRNNGLSGFPSQKVLNEVVRQINHAYPHLPFSTKPDSARNIKRIFEFFGGELELPQASMLIYQSSSETNTALSTKIPPTNAQIFASWDRFSNNNYYPGGVGAADGASTWSWNSTLNAAVQNNNTADWNGFISPELLDNYELDIVIKSSNTDDDTNGLVLSFQREGTTNHLLTLNVNQGGTNPPASHSINIMQGASIVSTLASTDFAGRNRNGGGGTGTDANGWNGRFTRVLVVRSGDTFTVQASNWNSLVLNPVSLMTVTLDSTAQHSRFKNKRAWGFINYSQAGSSFEILGIRGGIDYSIIIDAQSGKIYRYTGTNWVEMIGIDLKTLFGAPRNILNPETGKLFRLNVNGSLTFLN